MELLDTSSMPEGPPRVVRAAVVDDFAAYGASLAAALQRSGVTGVVRFDSHDAALGNRDALTSVDVVFVDVYRHAAERAADPHLSGVGMLDIVGLLDRAGRGPRAIVYGSWAGRPEIRLLVAELTSIEALYDSGTLLAHTTEALAGDHAHACRTADQADRAIVGIGPGARVIEAIATARLLGAEEGEPYGETWRLICEIDLGRDARRASGIPEAVRRAIGRRLVPLLDLPPDANYLDAVRIIQRFAAVGPR